MASTPLEMTIDELVARQNITQGAPPSFPTPEKGHDRGAMDLESKLSWETITVKGKEKENIHTPIGKAHKV